MSCRASVALALTLSLILTVAPLVAQGGPPLITDDPDTPGPGVWEINFLLQHERTHADRREEPLADLNYGMGRRIQLKLEAPWVVVREETGEHLSGPGNLVAGVKWRFLGEEERLLAWAVYPQYEFNVSSSSARKGLVSDGHRLMLPSELTLEIHGAEFNLEGGRVLASTGPDEWIYGFSTEVGLVSRVEFLGEIHSDKPDGMVTELVVHGGVRVKANCQLTLMAGAGWAVSGDPADRPRLLASGGVQLNLPGRFDFSHLTSLGVKRCK